MRRSVLIIITILCHLSLFAIEPTYGIDSVSSDWMQEWYHYSDWMHYLDNYNTFVTVEQETTGEYNHAASQVFSIAGNSYKWNKYYKDGFRVDSRFNPGSTIYIPNLYTEDMGINYYESAIVWKTNEEVANNVSVSGNIGGLGGISPGTKELIHTFHRNATERLYMPVGNLRNKTVGAGSVNVDYNIPSKSGQTYLQQVQAEYGQRKIVSFDETAINAYTPYDYMRLQFAGQLPIRQNKFIDNLNYIANYQYRADYGSEFFMNKNELANQNTGGLSAYGTKHTSNSNYVLGITWQTTDIKHHELDFSKNIIDQDGESFEPWYIDGKTTEFNLSTSYNHRLLDWLLVSYEGYNSLIYTTPSVAEWSNTMYWKYATDSMNIEHPAHNLYQYEWSSSPFLSGLLENTLKLDVDYQPVKWFRLRGDIDVTLDGICLGNKKSVIRPNWQAGLGLDFRPCNWFHIELNLQKKRVAFNYDDIKFLSSDYLNGKIYYLADNNQVGALYSTSGGKYHQAKEHIRQTSYFVFDIPVYFSFTDGRKGRHEIQFMQSYRKYWNCWNVETWSDAYATQIMDDIDFDGSIINRVMYAVNDGEKQYVLTDQYNDGIFGNSILKNSPFYVSSVIKYQYTGKKVFFSVAWQSYEMCGVSALGNGPQSNNLNILSESYANPNTWENCSDDTEHRASGRLDQDRAYVCWVQFTYNPIKQLGFTFTGKFKDGQPVTSYMTKPYVNANGNTQMIVIPARTRGINLFDDSFGSREDAFFDIDLRATYRPEIKGHKCEFQISCYNIYDFGTSLNEYSFPNGLREIRHTLSLCVPRGLLLSASVNL